MSLILILRDDICFKFNLNAFMGVVLNMRFSRPKSQFPLSYIEYWQEENFRVVHFLCHPWF